MPRAHDRSVSAFLRRSVSLSCTFLARCLIGLTRLLELNPLRGRSPTRSAQTTTMTDDTLELVSLSSVAKGVQNAAGAAPIDQCVSWTSVTRGAQAFRMSPCPCRRCAPPRAARECVRLPPFRPYRPVPVRPRLQVVGNSENFLVLVADLPEGAVDTSPQAVVLTRYIETFSTCRTSGTYILSLGKPARVRSSRAAATASPSVISAIRFPAGYFRNSSGGSGSPSCSSSSSAERVIPIRTCHHLLQKIQGAPLVRAPPRGPSLAAEFPRDVSGR
jgi:hypothetical protein